MLAFFVDMSKKTRLLSDYFPLGLDSQLMHLPKVIQKTIAFILGTCLSLCLIFLIYSQTLVTQLSQYGQSIIQDLNVSADQAFTSLALLNKSNFKQCSREHLLIMRKLQFESNDIKDIGFFVNNQVLCTTGAGVLDTPILEVHSGYVFEGHVFWFNQELKTFDNMVKGVIVRSENYNVVLSFRTLLVEHNLFSNYEVVARFEQRNRHLFGSRGLFRNDVLHQHQFIKVGLFSHRIELCGPKGFLCVAVQQDNFTEYQKSPLVFILFLIIILSGFTSLHIFGYIDRYLNSKKRRLRKGLESNKFSAFYQPIINLQTEQVVGCELLARFHDSKGVLPPTTFIPIMAQMDLSWPLTEYLVKRAINDLNQLEKMDNSLYLSINIYPKDINNGNVLKIIEVLKQAPKHLRIGFEITEDEELDFTKANIVLAKLHQAGVKISIDDFGTGYSNMAQLKSFNIDSLKIDKSFVDEVESGSIRSTLIPNIVSIAHKLDAQIIAEGVENILQVQELLKMDIQYGQGWLYSKALNAEEFKKYLNANSTDNL